MSRNISLRKFISGYVIIY